MSPAPCLMIQGKSSGAGKGYVVRASCRGVARAGRPAENNLAATEIVNMRIARLAEAPVLLIGDIDRGGVFASLVGTLALLEPEDRARIAGFVINRFRGERRVLDPGLDMLTGR